MNRIKYTPEIREEIKRIYQQHEGQETCRIINEKYGLSMNIDNLHGIVYRYGLHKRRNRTYKKPSIYTPEQIAFLKKTYARKSAKETADKFNAHFGLNVNPAALRTWMNRHGILSKDDGKFSPGAAPWNAGTKGLTGANEMSYKPGTLPPKTRPVGFESVKSDGSILVKVSADWNEKRQRFGIWQPKHKIVWEQHHGQVPDDKIIQFLNGDRSDCRIENLTLITHSVLKSLCHIKFWEQPDEVKPVLLTMTKLKMQILHKERSL